MFEASHRAGFNLTEAVTGFVAPVKSNLSSSSTAEAVEAGISSVSPGVTGKANIEESVTSYRLKRRGKTSSLVTWVTWAGAMIGATTGFFAEGLAGAGWGLLVGAFAGGVVWSLLCRDKTVVDQLKK